MQFKTGEAVLLLFTSTEKLQRTNFFYVRAIFFFSFLFRRVKKTQ